MTITIPPGTFFEPIIIGPGREKRWIPRRKPAQDQPVRDDEMTKSHGNKRKRSDDHPGPNPPPGQQRKRPKTSRVHPKEAHHQIEALPPLAQEFKSGETLNAAELAKSLGLEFRGLSGMSTEVWYVGPRKEQSEGLAESLRLSAEAASKDDDVVFLGQREKLS